MIKPGGTVGYSRKTGSSLGLKSKIKTTKAKTSWLAQKPAEKFNIEKHVYGPNGDTKSGLYKSLVRTHELEHDRDFYRLGGSPVTTPSHLSSVQALPSGSYERPHISWVKGPDGKIVAENKAKTLDQSKASTPILRRFGKPVTPTINGSGGKFVQNPEYPAYKAKGGNYSRDSQEYNLALSTQFGNNLPSMLTPAKGKPTVAFPAQFRTTYPTPGVKRPS
jgi:hypothetical protein